MKRQIDHQASGGDDRVVPPSGPAQSPLSPKMRSLSVAGSAEPMCADMCTHPSFDLFCERSQGHRGKHRHGRAAW